MRRPLISFGIILVILMTAATARSVAAQYPCCYEPPYVLYTYEGWNSQGQYVVWDYYSDGHWVGTCYAGCGYPYSYGYDLGAGASKPLALSLVATLGRGAALSEDVDEYWTDGSNYAAPDPYSSQQYGYYPTYNPWTGWTVTQCSPHYSGDQYGLIC